MKDGRGLQSSEREATDMVLLPGVVVAFDEDAVRALEVIRVNQGQPGGVNGITVEEVLAALDTVMIKGQLNLLRGWIEDEFGNGGALRAGTA